jgi:hypothetical protein
VFGLTRRALREDLLSFQHHNITMKAEEKAYIVWALVLAFAFFSFLFLSILSAYNTSPEIAKPTVYEVSGVQFPQYYLVQVSNNYYSFRGSGINSTYIVKEPVYQVIPEPKKVWYNSHVEVEPSQGILLGVADLIGAIFFGAVIFISLPHLITLYYLSRGDEKNV